MTGCQILLSVLTISVSYLAARRGTSGSTAASISAKTGAREIRATRVAINAATRAPPALLSTSPNPP